MDTYYEKLLNEAMSGDKGSLKELMSNAGSGNAEAQYYLALYYGNMKDNDNYLYWMEKAASYHHDKALQFMNNIKPNTTNKEQTNSSKTDRMVEGGVWIILGIILTIVFTGSSSSGYYVFYGAIIYGLYVLFLKK